MDEQALTDFVRTEYRRVVTATALSCGDAARAEDAVQHALVVAWERKIVPSSIAAWVTVAAMNHLRSGFRRLAAERRAQQRLGALASADPHTVDHSSLGNVDPLVATALRRLPWRQRQMVVLHYFLDLSVADVAASVGVTEGTVKTSLFRARESLRKELATVGDTSEEVGNVRSTR